MGLEKQPQNRVQELNSTFISEIKACSELGDEQNDVLHANRIFRELPSLIRNKDYQTLIDSTELLALEAQDITPETARARDFVVAQRDLAMFVTLATLIAPKTQDVRHFGEGSTLGVPVAEDVVPNGARELIRLSRILDVPARMEDSNWTNSPRFFSDTLLQIEGNSVKAEALIKTCVGKNWEKLDEKIANVMELTKMDVKHPRFAEVIAKTTEVYTSMVAGIAISRLYLTRSPEGLSFFRDEFLPATMPIIVGGKKLLHSGSGYPIPHIVDALVGITSSDNPDDLSYRSQNLFTAPSSHRLAFARAIDYIEEHGTLIEQLEANPDARESAQGVLDLLKENSKFRGGHEGGVRETEPTRENNESSGERKEMVYDLKDRTFAARDQVATFIKAA